MCVARQVFMLFILLIGMNELYAQNYNTSFLGNWNDDNLVNHFVRYNDIWGYADQSGREYAIIGSRHFTHFIDVTNPEGPIEVDRELGGTSCIWRDYKTFGQYLYGVSDQCNDGIWYLGPSLAVQLSRFDHLLKLSAQTNELIIDGTAVSLDLSFARAAEEAKTTTLTLQVRPAPHKAALLIV